MRARIGTPTRKSTAASDAVAATAAVLAAVVVWFGALPYFFAQDDFTGLARARGLLPPLEGPWRFLSGPAYFGIMNVVAGLNPLPYRIVTLLAHTACVLLVYRLCRRWSGPGAAAVGATYFGTHPALFTALYSISGIGEILAGLLLVAALLVADVRDRRRWMALPLFTASLLCKETTVLAPLLLLPWLTPARAEHVKPSGAAPRRRALPIALGAVSLLYLASFLLRDSFGLRSGVTAEAPYALRVDRSLIENLFTYLGWTARIALPAVHSFSDRVDRSVFGEGLMLLLAWAVGLAARALRERGWLWGGALFALTIAPVLPLVNHTYHYYLYTPLAGAACCVAALADALAARLAAGRVAPAFARALLAGAVVALAINAVLLVRKIENYPFLDPELRAESTVDRARIARNAIGDLGAAPLPGVTLRFWSPASRARQRAAGADSTDESYWETNVRSALYDGLAVRLFHPELREVQFVRDFDPAGDAVRYAVYLPTGHLRLGTPAELDSVMRRRAARAGTP